MSGWLKVHRSISDHWIWDFSEPDKAMAWMDLLFMARHADGKMKIKGRIVEIKRGEVGVSQMALQKRWKWSQNKVKRFLKLLESDSMIEFRANELTTIISICNFEKYQADERAGERTNEQPGEPSGERSADDHPDDQSNEDIRKKELKNDKNDKNKNHGGDSDSEKPEKPNLTKADLKKLHPEIPGNLVDEWYLVRRDKKLKTLPKTSWAHILNEIKKSNLTNQQAIKICVVKGWAGFEAKWLNEQIRAAAQDRSAPPPSQPKDYSYGVDANGHF